MRWCVSSGSLRIEAAFLGVVAMVATASTWIYDATPPGILAALDQSHTHHNREPGPPSERRDFAAIVTSDGYRPR